mgnify:CR=1 FL=1
MDVAIWATDAASSSYRISCSMMGLYDMPSLLLCVIYLTWCDKVSQRTKVGFAKHKMNFFSLFVFVLLVEF